MHKHSYRVEIQYLGFRYHGWQAQAELRTIQHMVEKTLHFIRPGQSFKVLGASRTDARVSANHTAFQLILAEALPDPELFLKEFDSNLPTDIRALAISPMPAGQSIIQASTAKEYLYLFCHGNKPHPFCSSLLAYFPGNLDIPLMQKGARLFEGEHNFKQYCTKPPPGSQLVRTIDQCELTENNIYQASFFPAKSYMLRIRSAGFLRYQIRLIMARLADLGRHEISLQDIRISLSEPNDIKLRNIAPGSGLILNNQEWKF